MKCRLTSKKKRREDDMSKLDRIVHEKAKEASEEIMFNKSKAFDAVVLMTVREILGFGKDRLERFYKIFLNKYEAIMDKYGLTDAVIVKLKEDTGLDMDELYNKYVGKDEVPSAQSNYEAEIEYLRRQNEILEETCAVQRKLLGGQK